MALLNTSSTYGGIAKTFHWLTALLLISTFGIGYFANQIAHHIASSDFDGSQSTIDQAVWLFSFHKTLGVATFLVALFRILWAVTQVKPGLLHPDRKAESLAAETVHWLLYGSLVIVPLTGWIHHAATAGYAPIYWPFGQNLPLVPKSEALAAVFSVLHGLFVWVLFVALGLHVAGALKHHIIDRDSTLLRMLPGNYKTEEPPEQRHSSAPAGLALTVWAAVVLGAFVYGSFGTKSPSGAGATDLAEVNSDWTVDTGLLTITVTQLGSPIVGEFSDWTASISFEEPATPGKAGDVEVIVAIGSLTLGTVTSKAMGNDFFAQDQFPTARFAAEIEKLDAQYVATGTLTIRDQTVPVTLPFVLESDGERAKMSGQVVLNRLDFGIGQSVTDESSLAFAVEVNVELEAVRNN